MRSTIWVSGVLLLFAPHFSALKVSALLAASDRAEEGKIQLNALRIESLGENGEGRYLTLKNFFYVGSPTFSKDGLWIAFDGYSGDMKSYRAECWIVGSDGKGLRKLADGATPRWSPDGRQLLFMRERRSTQKGEAGIFIINRDGTREHRICEGRWPDWSPDGKKMVFSVGGRETKGGTAPGARVCVANVDGTGQEEIANGDCPSYSPDGRRIACSYADPAMPAPLIRVVDLQSREERFLGYGWFRANWSADSKSLYANGMIGPKATGMVKLSTGSPSKTEPLFVEFRGESPCPSSDGKRLVFCTPAKSQ